MGRRCQCARRRWHWRGWRITGWRGQRWYAGCSRYSDFTAAQPTALTLALLDFSWADENLPVDIQFSVSNHGGALLSASFDSLNAATAYFTSGVHDLGTFSGAVELELMFVVNSSNSPVFAMSYLLAGMPPVPEAPSWTLMLAGMALLQVARAAVAMGWRGTSSSP